MFIEASVSVSVDVKIRNGDNLSGNVCDLIASPMFFSCILLISVKLRLLENIERRLGVVS